MRGVRSFIIGFCLSLASMSAYGQLFHSLTPNKTQTPLKQTLKIDLFKAPSATETAKPVHIFADVQKVSLAKKVEAPVAEPLPDVATNAPEDDEIMSVNVDGIIPIEFSSSDISNQRAEIVNFDDEEVSAMLPTEIEDDMDASVDSPWVAAKGSKHIKNKQLLEDFADVGKIPQLSDDFKSASRDDESSYKVAEKIKSSLLFPIPSEILNDENLVPTFIKKPQKATSSTPEPKVAVQALPAEQPKPAQDDLKLIPKVATQTAPEESSSKGLLSSISSWFSSDKETPESTPEKVIPSYSSQGRAPTATTATAPAATATTATTAPQPSSNSEFVNFYKTLQETSQAHKNNAIIPSELKLSFQPERAEISGQTLRWLKAFSEAAQREDTYLQVRLDASASTELQKKRLSLLYTIFMNNGVDFKKIDTVFSLTEPNAFIIRTLKLK